MFSVRVSSWLWLRAKPTARSWRHCRRFKNVVLRAGYGFYYDRGELFSNWSRLTAAPRWSVKDVAARDRRREVRELICGRIRAVLISGSHKLRKDKDKNHNRGAHDESAGGTRTRQSLG
jgi:hypothetical protein